MPPSSDLLRFGAVKIDLSELEVSTPRGELPLTRLEASVLRFLLARRGTTVSREQLLAQVWEYSSRTRTRAVDNTISRLRKKIEEDPSSPRWLVSTRGGGYRLERDPDELPQVPAEADEFVGRRDEIDRLEALFSDGARLVSLVGMGGIGKTRLAVHFAAAFGAEVRFMDLSSARDRDELLKKVADAIDISLGSADHVRQLASAIASLGPALLVLDNFEQLVPWARETVGVWLASSRIRLLVTSRERLGLVGEHLVEVPPLPPEEAADLFECRARRVSPRFVPGSAGEVGHLVERLDHIPLAIELAAARSNLLSPSALLERMGDRFRLLVAGAGREPRHATLEATLDWSWALLSPDEAVALAQLSVFRSAFSLEAAEWVLRLPLLPALDALQMLVDRSLVRRFDEERFVLLPTVREYAHTRLGEEDDAYRRHGAWFAEMGTETAITALHGPDWSRRFRVLTDALDDLVAASERAVQRGEATIAARTARAAAAVYIKQGPVRTGIRLLDAAAAVPDLEPGLLATVRFAAGQARRFAGDAERAREDFEAASDGFEAGGLPQWAALAKVDLCYFRNQAGEDVRPELERAIAIFRETRERAMLATTLRLVGMMARQAGRNDEATARYEEALACARAGGHGRIEVEVLLGLANLRWQQGQLDEARRRFGAVLRLVRELGDQRSEAVTTSNLGSLEIVVGNLDLALALVEDALRFAQRFGERAFEIHCRSTAALILADLERPSDARVHIEIGLPLARELGDIRGEALLLDVLGGVEEDGGRLDEARRLYEAALDRFQRIRDARMASSVTGRIGRLDGALGNLASARALLGEAEDRLRSIGARFELGLILCYRADLDRRCGDLAAGQRACAEAERLAEEIGAGSGSAVRRALARIASGQRA